MTYEEARKILASMMDGVDPLTGEVLPPDHLLNQPQVMRALNAAIYALSLYEYKVPATEKPAVQPQTIPELSYNRPWTQQDLDELRRLYQAKTPITDICRQLHRRRSSVREVLTSLALPPIENTPSRKRNLERAGLPWDADDELILLEMLEQNFTVNEIARELYRTPHAIFCHIRSHLAPTPPSKKSFKWTEQRIDELQQMYTEGKSITEIADHFEKTEGSIKALLFYKGLSRDAPVKLPIPPQQKEKE